MAAKLIIAVDALGVHAIAGPLTAGAVIYAADRAQPTFSYEDSKHHAYNRMRLLETARQIPGYVLPRVSGFLRKDALSWAVMTRGASEITNVRQDRLTLLGLAAARAMERMKHFHPEKLQDLQRDEVHIFVPGKDALSVDMVSTLQQHLGAEGDWRVGAAAAVARQVHNQEFQRIAQRFPNYGFERHYGYPTTDHKRLLRNLGPTPEHRHAAI